MSAHIVALERDVLNGSLTRARMGALDLVIWLGASGAIHVWQDRCPHRSVRLSAGRNMGTYLEDPYHGWQFGEDGTVIAVPAERGKPHPEISARVLPSKVAGGFVWAGEGEVIGKPLQGTPARPLHFAVPTETLRPHLDPNTNHLTPWGDAESMVYPTSDDPLVCFNEMSALRRRLEGTA